MPQHVHALRLLCTAVHQRLQRQALFLCQALCISLQASCLQAGIYLLPVQTLSDPDASPAWRINHSAPAAPCRRPRSLTVSSWCRRGHTPPQRVLPPPFFHASDSRHQQFRQLFSPPGCTAQNSIHGPYAQKVSGRRIVRQYRSKRILCVCVVALPSIAH